MPNTIGDCSKELRKSGRGNRHILPMLTMFVQLWNGVSASTEILKLASDSRLLPRPFSCYCPWCLNATVGRSEQYSRSMMPLATGPRRCIFRRASEFHRCKCTGKAILHAWP